MARSLNKVQLIGNLTRDPELRYTPQGAAVCTIGIATNREWKTDSGEKKEDVEFHKLVAWNKLAEICANLLKKGRKIYVEGRLQTRSWQAQDGSQKSTTEIVISDMIILDPRRDGDASTSAEFDMPDEVSQDASLKDEAPVKEEKSSKKKGKSEKEEPAPEAPVGEEDIPF